MKPAPALLVAGVAACGLVLTACGGSDAGDASQTAATAQPPKTPAVPIVTGEPVVTASSYGLVGTTGYQTAVSFTVSNPSDQPIVNAHYRVTVASARGKTLATTDGSDTISLAPRAQTVVVATPDVEGTRPVSATVKLYDGDPADGAVVPGPSGWRTENPTLRCDSVSVGCDVTADVTWTGKGSPSVSHVDAVVRRRPGGTVIAAGQLSANGTFTPGRTVPVSGFVTGNETFRDSAPENPVIELYPQVSVDATGAGPGE